MYLIEISKNSAAPKLHSTYGRISEVIFSLELKKNCRDCSEYEKCKKETKHTCEFVSNVQLRL